MTGTIERVRPAPPFPRRLLAVALEAFVALSGLLGTVLLLSGTSTPPVSDLAWIGLHSWVVPGLWLFSSVVVPSAVACVAVLAGRSWAPTAVLLASGLLLLELLVQIPFVGVDPLQPIMAVPALALAALAFSAPPG